MSALDHGPAILFCPADRPERFGKALERADGVILDLEDAVAPDAKPAARHNACAAAQSGEYGRRELTIRINAAGTEWHEDDLDDGEVGDRRSGRLVDPDRGLGEDHVAELVGDDIGIDGAGSSAEEAAVHIVGEDD